MIHSRTLVGEFGRSRSFLVGLDYQMRSGEDVFFRTAGGSLIDPSIVRSGGIAPTWYWGDGDSDTGDSVSHTYAEAGNYAVTWNAVPSSIITLDIRLDEITELNTNEEWTNLATFSCYSNSITSFDTFSAWTNLVTFYCHLNDLTSLDTFSTWTNLATFYCYSNSLTSIDVFAAWTNLTDFRCHNNSLTAIVIDDFLINLDAAGATNGILRYQNNPGSADIDRSPAAATAKANLISKGWVITN